MEEQLNILVGAHLLQHTLRSLCIHGSSHSWAYAVFWRILPRNYPPPRWDLQCSVFDRNTANRRNWILAWEDGFCNFDASTSVSQQMKGLQPELFFKMSHEIYCYGEGLIGKVAAGPCHKWVFSDSHENYFNSLHSWNSSVDPPRAWEAQFQAGIKTIALVAVREGVIQLGAMNKVVEDLSYVVLLRKKFSLLESIPGFLLPHPSSSTLPTAMREVIMDQPTQDYGLFGLRSRIAPSMSSREAIPVKLPAVGSVPPGAQLTEYYESMALERMIAEEEMEWGNDGGTRLGGEGSDSIIYKDLGST